LTGVPIFSLDDVRVADDNTVLWSGSGRGLGTLILEDVDTVDGIAAVWTGTNLSGTAPHPMGATNVTQGVAGVLDDTWIDSALVLHTSLASLYALSDVLTVPAVPEPSSFLLLGGAMSWTTIRTRRRQRPQANHSRC